MSSTCKLKFLPAFMNTHTHTERERETHSKQRSRERIELSCDEYLHKCSSIWRSCIYVQLRCCWQFGFILICSCITRFARLLYCIHGIPAQIRSSTSLRLMRARCYRRRPALLIGLHGVLARQRRACSVSLLRLRKPIQNCRDGAVDIWRRRR